MSVQAFRLQNLAFQAPAPFCFEISPFFLSYRRITTSMHLPHFPVPPSVPLNHTTCSHGPACTMQVKQLPVLH